MSLHFVDAHTDPWHRPPAEGLQRPAAALLLDASQWQTWRHVWPAELPVGVQWPNDGDLGPLVPDLPRLRLIALVFPKWTDGRAYSQARLLRGRWCFRGELRATGDVIADMAPLLWRCGFDSAQLRPGESVTVAQRALTAFDTHYQPDVRHHPQPHHA